MMAADASMLLVRRNRLRGVRDDARRPRLLRENGALVAIVAIQGRGGEIADAHGGCAVAVKAKQLGSLVR